ncbi:MAG: leucine-rich repeat domain-containing protein [Ruminococcaceae bacterium]|nr:leucine-rich repeat domain-containing protein [Oscillospiraceae bacterium]
MENEMESEDFVIENGVLIKYTGYDKEVAIPDCVTEIGEEAFCFCNLESVVIPGNVTKIRYSAFEGSNLKSIVIEDGVVEIDARAFMECAHLVDITLPASIKSIGYKAFLVHFYVKGLDERRIISAPKNSYAEQYAKDHGIRFNAI